MNAGSSRRVSGSYSDNRKSAIQNPKWVGIFAIAFTFTIGGAVVQAQQPKKVSRIGLLMSADSATDFNRTETFRAALRELGYIEGQNINIEYRYADGKLDRFSELAVELVRLKVDIIVAGGGGTRIRTAMNATKTIPIVMTGTGLDPVKEGLVESLAHPGGNVTGITNLGRELTGKRLELLKEAVPKLVRIAVLYDPNIPDTAREMKEDFTVAARAMGLAVRSWEVRDADDLEKAFAAINKERPDGLFLLGMGPLMRANLKRITGFALRSRLPSMYGEKDAVDAGGLMSYVADRTESHRRVAYYVDRILKGAKPADLPIEQPKKFALIINLKTAKQIGLTIPPQVLARADKVIK